MVRVERQRPAGGDQGQDCADAKQQGNPARVERSVKMQHCRLPDDWDLLTLKEAAGVLQVSVRTAARWCRAGRLPGVKIGHAWRIRKRDLLSVIAPRKAGACPQPTAVGGAGRWC
jgi:excisionase family DNA binding protein